MYAAEPCLLGSWWWRLVEVSLLLVLAGCGATNEPMDAAGDATGDATVETMVPPPPEGLGGSARLLMNVTVTPNWVSPGSTAVLQVEVPDAPSLQDSAWVSYEAGNFHVPLTRTGDIWTGALSLSAPTRVADHRIDVRTYFEDGEALGYGLLHVSNQPKCPAGERRQGGTCHPAFEGGILRDERRVLRTNRYADGRNMVHPRAIYRAGDKLVACITDAMAIMRLEDLVRLDDVLLFSGEDGSHMNAPALAPYTETMLYAEAMSQCNDMVFDEARGIAMSATKRNLSGPGGITTWRYPDMDAEELTPPEPLDVYFTFAGFERLAWDGEWLYGTEHPGRLVVMTVDDDGKIDEVGRAYLEGSLAAWALAVEGDIVYVTDAGDHQVAANSQMMHDGEEHSSGPLSGRVYAIDVSDPAAPLVLGWTATVGLGKGITVLGDGIVAVGGGATGVELIDMSNPRNPIHLHVYPTPGLAHGVHFSNGLLAVAAWESVVLYDASERGVLRQLDVEGFVGGQLPPSLSSLVPYGGLFGAGFVHLDDDLLIVNDWNAIMVATMRRGGGGPRALVIPRSVTMHAGKDTAEDFTVRVHNGGRESLWVEGVESDDVHFLQGGHVVPPMGYGDVDLQVQPELPASTYFVLQTNDIHAEARGVHVSLMDDNYALGDEVPPFRLPSVNDCESVPVDEPCDMTVSCFDSRTAQAAGKPVVIAFFSAW